jgi:hypothetical protein
MDRKLRDLYTGVLSPLEQCGQTLFQKDYFGAVFLLLRTVSAQHLH